MPYLAMTDRSLLDARQRIRPLMQRYNNYPWPDPPTPYFGPDERQAILGEIFGISLETIKQAPIEIEPPFYVDYVRPFPLPPVLSSTVQYCTYVSMRAHRG